MDNQIKSHYYQYHTPMANVFNKFSLNKKMDRKSQYYLYSSNKTNTNINKNNNENSHFSFTVGSMIIATGIGILTFSKVAQKNISKYLFKLKRNLENRLEISTLEESHKESKFYSFTINRLNSFIKKSESINNITSLKDVLFMKLMYKTKPTRYIHESISKLFENLSKKTVINSYKSTEKAFGRMYRAFDKLDNYILKENPDEIIRYNNNDYTKKELIKKARNYRDTAKIVVSNFVSPKSVENRYKHIKKLNSSLYSTFWDASFKDFWSKNNKFKRKEMWQTFIAAEQMKGDKSLLAEDIALVRNTVTYTDKDKTKLIHDYIENLKNMISKSDYESLNVVEKLEWFTRSTNGLKNNKEIFLKELKNLSNIPEPPVDSSNIQKAKNKSIKTYINLINELANDNTTGELQDMLSIYYKVAPFELSKSGASLAFKKALNSFDKSVDKELVQFFDKVRDLELGSAPTDILTVLISLGLIIRGLNYSTTDNQRISVMLKSGIPIVGALVTSIMSATKLVSGGKSLALGFISGFILNRLGVVADNIRKKVLS